MRGFRVGSYISRQCVVLGRYPKKVIDYLGRTCGTRVAPKKGEGVGVSLRSF